MREENNLQNLGIFYLVLGLVAGLFTILLFYPQLLAFFEADNNISRASLARINKIRYVFLALSLTFNVISAIIFFSFNTKYINPKLINRTIFISVLLFCIVSTELSLAIKYGAVYGRVDPYGLTEMPSNILLDEYLGYSLKPNSYLIDTINSLGFRGAEWNIASESDFNILTLGNSITFGWGLSQDSSTYSAKLKKLFERENPDNKIQVRNAGVPGYTSAQVLRLLESKMLNMKPDLIVLCVGWNDIDYGYRKNWHSEIFIEESSVIPENKRFSPAILRFISLKLGGGKNGELNHGALKYYRSNLKKIIKACQTNDIKIIMLNLPTVLSEVVMNEEEQLKARRFANVEEFKLFQRVIDEVCKKDGVDYISNVFEVQESNKNEYFLDACHPTDKGNQVIASKIYSYIIDHNLIDFKRDSLYSNAE